MKFENDKEKVMDDSGFGVYRFSGDFRVLGVFQKVERERDAA